MGQGSDDSESSLGSLETLMPWAGAETKWGKVQNSGQGDTIRTCDLFHPLEAAMASDWEALVQAGYSQSSFVVFFGLHLSLRGMDKGSLLR
jgi:hypothetical protein